ncbi:hypothetical protein ID866_7790 [Astraeus odoratus]|nr:hypothetical protein ID866_7790 [Astraeus odoratus]
MEDERMDQEAFRTAVLADKRRGASKRSPYTVGLTGQVKALTIRQFQMRLQDRFQLVTSFSISALLGLIIGGAFFSMPETAAGAFTRAGMIFMTILTICLEAFTEVFNKQTLYGFYRPAAVVLANTLADIPFSATRILLFDIIIYFMARLAPSASGFCVFHLFVYLAYLSLQGFFRTLGLLFVSPHSAFRLATFIAASVIQYSGYMTAIFTVKRWLLWIYHLNPFAYGWAGAMENEFPLTQFKCDGSYIVPRNSPGMTKYPNDNPSYQQDKVFTWENVTYHVPVADGTRRLLHNVCGYIKPGTLTALMGASGAGRKTTCLDVLSQRKNVGVITGDILINGRPLGTDFVRKTAYAEQMDIHEGTATVREAMRFSAYLRQPVEVPIEEKNQYVEDIIELLELQDLSEALVFSLSVEARKRLTIAVELASKPALLLFLDEPTSGLDAQSAWNIVRFLRKLADQGQAILCTIHQPSSLLFENFDRLLLLESGGETVYFGDIGKDSHVVREYFARYGAHCPPYANPAEYMLEAIGAGLSPRIGSRDWMDIWLDSPEYKRLREEIDEIRSQALERPAPAQEKSRSYATSFLYQLRVVVKRNNIALWRSPDYVFSRLSVHALCSLNVSLSFLQLGNNVRDLQSRVFGIFWLGVLPPIIVAQLEPLFISNRNTFIREASSRIYSPYVFAIAQLIGEIPYSILSAIVYWALMVYPMGFGKGALTDCAAGQYGNVFQLLITVLMEFFGVSFGQLIAALSPSIHIAVLFNPILGIVLPIFCGVTIPYPTLKPFWRDWAYPLDPYTRSVSAMLSTELHGLPIRCAQNEFVVFNPPTNQTCAEWAGDFVTAFGGYLDDPDATTACHYCHYAVGDEFFLPLNMRFENRWRDALILFSFFVFNFIATIVASRLLRYAKR